ncbi:MAG: glycosyltransferase [Dehalococcoidia bacterium]
MRVALAVEGTRGDVYPLLALGAALRGRGHSVLVCGPPDFEPVTRERGMDFRPVGDSVREYLEAHAEVLAGRGLAVLREGARYLSTCLDAQFGSLPGATRDVDRIIGGGIQLAGPSVAELHGIPYRYLVYCPALLPSSEHAPILLPLQSMPSWANRISWRAALALHDRLLRPALNRKRAALGLKPIHEVYRHLVTPRPLLAADEELAPYPIDCPFEVERIGCLHPMQGDPLPAKLVAFLEQGPAPVYFGFGSMTDPDPARTTRGILQAVTTLGCRAILSQGWAGLGEVALPEGVITIGPVSHAELFPHVAAVVHHGGAGTTTTAARAGVPQILIPHVLDQFYWAKRVTLLGLGPPPIPRNKLAGECLEIALSMVLDNETLSERAHDLGVRLRSRSSDDVDLARLLA